MKDTILKYVSFFFGLTVAVTIGVKLLTNVNEGSGVRLEFLGYLLMGLIAALLIFYTLQVYVKKVDIKDSKYDNLAKKYETEKALIEKLENELGNLAPDSEVVNKAMKYLGIPTGEEDEKPTSEEEVRGFMDYVVNGLTSEVAKTRFNSQVNLAIGGGTSLVAITILSLALLNNTNFITKPSDFYNYIPRVTLSIFIEFFSFFFLKLYRRNLDDIKYLTNEITNVRLKLLALKASYLKNAGDSTPIILKELSKTERNFILKKNESTVEIQRQKIESDDQGKIIDKILSILKSK